MALAAPGTVERARQREDEDGQQWQDERDVRSAGHCDDAICQLGDISVG